MNEPLRLTIDETKCGGCAEPCERDFPGVRQKARDGVAIERREITASWIAQRSCKQNALQAATEVWE